MIAKPLKKALLITLIGMMLFNLTGLSFAQSDRVLLAASSVQFDLQGQPWVNLVPSPTSENYLDLTQSANILESAQPRALAAADLNRDGVPDVIAGYAAGSAGVLGVYWGNPALPDYPELPAFLPQVSVLDIPVLPDLLAAGDFNADGALNLVVAALGGRQVYVLGVDAAGELQLTGEFKLPGTLTAFAAGEIGRQDGLSDLALAVDTDAGPRVLVYAGGTAERLDNPVSLPLAASANALAIGQLDADYPYDLALLAGDELLIWHAADQFALEGGAAPYVERIALGQPARALALGNFIENDSPALEIAVLTADGQVQILAANPAAEAQAGFQLASSLPSLDQAGTPTSQLRAARLSSLPTDDLLLVDPERRLIQVMTADGRRLTPEGLFEQALAPGSFATIALGAAPALALPLRLNADALDDLVILTGEAPAPAVLLSTAARVFTVNQGWDIYPDANPGDGKCETPTYSWGGPFCTLRAAIQEANASAGADEIRFNITLSTDQTIYLQGTGNLLPVITEAVTIFGVSTGHPTTLDGRHAGAGVAMQANGSSVSVSGLIFRNFVQTSLSNPLIKLAGTGNHLISNSTLGPLNNGIAVDILSGGNTLYNNIVSGNALAGVRVSSGDGNRIGGGNYLGLPAGIGTTTNQTGILVTGGSNATIGNSSQSANIISGNTGSGIEIDGGSGTLILNNYIGVNDQGSVARLNNYHGIVIAGGSGTTIGNGTSSGRNLVNSSQYGIQISAAAIPNTIIRANYFGLNAAGNAAISSAAANVAIHSTNLVQVKDNVIGSTGTGGYGVYILGPSSSTTIAHSVTGNYIGTNPAGDLNLGNLFAGIYVSTIKGVQITGNTIKYTNQAGLMTNSNASNTAISDNNISQSGQYGMQISGNSNSLTNNWVGYTGLVSILVTGSSNNLTGNTVANPPSEPGVIGVELRGTGNSLIDPGGYEISGGSIGVSLRGSGNSLAGYTVHSASTGVRLDGTDNVVGPGNLINNNEVGIEVAQAASGGIVKGNYLGVDASGNAALPNYSVNLLCAGTNTTIGGGSPSDGNVISGGALYAASGLQIWGGSGTIVRNNKIGVGANGTTPLGNLYGIYITGGSVSTIQDNLIAHNTTGILIDQGTRHQIIGNSIHSNASLGIDLSPAGVTSNDTGDGDTGANELQNFPVITLAGVVSGGTRAVGMLDSLPSQTYTIRLYSSPSCDSSGYGQGQTYLGQGSVTTNASGQANINLTVGTAASTGHYLAATASTSGGNTSEFSACYGPLGVLGVETLTVNTVGDAVDNNLTDGVCDSSASAGEQCTLRAAIQQANANVGANTIVLPAGTYPLTIAGTDNTAAAGDLDITDNLTISGAGANVTIIQSQVSDRVLHVLNNSTVSITGVGITGGTLSSTDGAGVYLTTGATLTMDAVSVHQNQTSTGSGGGIYSAGALTLTNSAVISNTAGSETNGGGGLYLLGGSAMLRNTTVSGNQSKGNGGGILNMLATINLNNVSVVYNTADSDNDGGDGGGLWTGTSLFSLQNSVIAENQDLSAGIYPYGQADCSGTFTTLGYNLVGDVAKPNDANPAACLFTGAGTNDHRGGFWAIGRYLRYGAGLGTLRLNGGTTLNHSPLTQSVGLTIDQANPATPGSGGNACEPFDQRGQTRPLDGGTDGIARCDRGAVEHIPAYLSIGDASVVEGTAAQFAVSLSVPAQITFTVQYSTSDITALAGLDYTHQAGTLTFLPGQTSKTITVPTLTDAFSEDTEIFRVRLFSPQYVFISDGEGLGSISDGSPLPSIAINDRSATEGDQGSSSAMLFTVSLNSPSAKTVTVDYATANGSALAGEDYVATQGTLTFAPGVTSQALAVTILGDNWKEGNQTFTVQLSNPGNGTLGDASGTGTIIDDDTPSFSVYNTSFWEGESGTSTMYFLVELSKPSTGPVSVQYSTSPGSALPGSDYLHTSGTLTFTAGETIKTIGVEIIGDEITEQDETFTLALSTPSSGTTITRGTATATILDDGGSPMRYIFIPMVMR